MKVNIYFWVTLLIAASSLSYCGREGEVRYARYPLSLRKKPDKKAARLTWISKGEKLWLLEPIQGDFVKVRIAGGEEGYVESKHLALGAIVLTTEDVKLKRRPSDSSGNSYTAKNIRRGGVAFIQKRLKSEEGGEWLQIVGGSGGKTADFPYFQGWIKKDSGYVSSPAIVQSALDLATAIRKKDLEALRKLSDEPTPIGPVATAKIVDLESIQEEPLEQDTEVAPPVSQETETGGEP